MNHELSRRLERIHERIREACRRAGRPAESVTLIGVTKGVPIEMIRQALLLGLRDIGENRAQEARAKQADPTTSNLEQPVRWHLIGHLQSNKAKLAAELFDVIQSADSLSLIAALERHAAKQSKALQVFMQVNVSGERAKFGCQPGEVEVLARAVLQCPHLHLKGLMTMAPFSSHSEDSRPHFRRLRELRDALTHSLHHSLTQSLQLSMGMSGDFEVAIEEGADVVRIGTAIFGVR